MRQRQLLTFYLADCQSRPRVPFCHAGMFGEPFLAKYLSSDYTVSDVGLFPETGNRRRIASYDADVVQHCCFIKKLAVHRQLGMMVADFQHHLRYLPAVGEQYLLTPGILFVIFMYEFLWIHGLTNFLPSFT